MPTLYLAIVGSDDLPLYLLHFGAKAKQEDLNQLIIHASLDIVDTMMVKSTNMYLGQVDKFNKLICSAFVSAGCTKFVLLHGSDSKEINDFNIRQFFNDVYAIYLKLLMNPFYIKGSPIKSQRFGQEIRNIAKLHFKI